MGSLYPGKIQATLLFSSDNAAKFHFGSGSHGVEGTAGSCHGSTFQRTHLLYESFFYIVNNSSNLGNIMDLSVLHGPGFVLLSFRGNNLQSGRGFVSHNANNAAGTNIQGKDLFVFCFCPSGGPSRAAGFCASLASGAAAGIFSFWLGIGLGHSSLSLEFCIFHKNSPYFFSQKKVNERI